MAQRVPEDLATGALTFGAHLSPLFGIQSARRYTRVRQPAVVYFAYGSNLRLQHLRDWISRCGVDPDGISNPRQAHLEGFRFRTNHLRTGSSGAANIERCPRGRVEGIIYDLTGKALLALRRKEGYPFRYYEITVPVLAVATNQLVPALTYSVTPEHRLARNVPVSPEYRQLIIDGAAEHGLSSAYRKRLARLLKVAPSTSDLSELGECISRPQRAVRTRMIS